MSEKVALIVSHLQQLTAISKPFNEESTANWRRLAKKREYQKTADEMLLGLAMGDLPQAFEISRLYCKSGQMYARSGNKNQAIDCFYKALMEPELHAAALKWNCYIKGTIAFLNGDKNALMVSIQNFLKGKYLRSFQKHLCFLQNMLTHFDKSYSVVYEMSADEQNRLEV